MKRSKVKKQDRPSVDYFCPFGYPEGSKIDYRQIAEEFVAFSGETWGDLATRGDDLRMRVVAGRRGSGKTVYLRRLEDYCKRSDELHAVPRETTPPTSDLVFDFHRRCSGLAIAEQWQLIWRRAIVRAAASSLMEMESVRAKLDSLTWENLGASAWERSGGHGPRRGEGIYSALTSILFEKKTRHELQSYLHADFWNEAERSVAAALARSPRLCFFLDEVDGNFDSAPRYWLECHVGLVLAVLDLLDEARYGGNLHVFIAAREPVLLKLIEGAQGYRVAAPPYVRRLVWDARAARYLLEEKISRLPYNLLAGPGASTALVRWLGVSEVEIASRRSRENISDYLLRHTRLLPRDIVRLGNQVAFNLQRATWFDDVEPAHDPIVEGVHSAATLIGEELIKECVLSMVLEGWPCGASQRGLPDDPSASERNLHELRSTLRRFVKREARSEVLSGARLHTLRKSAETEFPGVDLLRSLWLAGLLGFVDGRKSRKAVFSFSAGATTTSLPEGKETYLFHSSLIEAVGLRSSRQGAIPIA